IGPRRPSTVTEGAQFLGAPRLVFETWVLPLLPLALHLRRQRSAALLADAHLGVAFKLVANAGRAAAWANQQYVGNMNRRFLLGDAPLDVSLRVGPHVLL